jgi:hypothetical protein
VNCTHRGLYPPGITLLNGGLYTEGVGEYSHWAGGDGTYCQFASCKNGGMCLNPKRGRTVLTRNVGKEPNVKMRIKTTGVLRPVTTGGTVPTGWLCGLYPPGIEDQHTGGGG